MDTQNTQTLTPEELAVLEEFRKDNPNARWIEVLIDRKTGYNADDSRQNYQMQKAWGILGALVGSGYLHFDLAAKDELNHLRAVLMTIAQGIEFSE